MWSLVHRARPYLTGAAVLACAACGDGPLGPQLDPTDLCVSQSDRNSVVAFEDPNLAAEVRSELGLRAGAPMTCRQIAELESLGANDAGITSLVGIQNLTALKHLVMADNSISDLGPLSDLTTLEIVDLQGNQITDLGPLAALDLIALSLTRNSITDIRPLASLTGLQLLALDHNQISDIGALAGMVNMLRLVLFANTITDLTPLADMSRLDLLDMGENPTPDLEPLRNLTTLTVLGLDGAAVTDIGPVEPLIFLRLVVLDNNNDLADIQPLIDNRGFGTRSTLQVQETRVSCADVKVLSDRGVTVISDCT